MAPTLYHVPKTISSPIYQIILELELTKDQITVETMAFGDLKSATHLARNPMGTSPTFTDDGDSNDMNKFAIWESGAVLTYILTTLDTDFRLHPDPQQCSKADLAKFLNVQQFIIATAYPFLASLYIHTLQPKEQQDDRYVETAIGTFRSTLGPVLRDFLGDGPFLMGERISAIDYLIAKPLNNANSLGLLSEEEFPTLLQLFQRIRCQESFVKAYDLDGSDDCNCRAFRLIPAPNQDTDTSSEEKRNMQLR